MCSIQFTNKNKINNTFSYKFHLDELIFRDALTAFFQTLLSIGNLWLQLTKQV